jgi:hypothetical protein
MLVLRHWLMDGTVLSALTWILEEGFEDTKWVAKIRKSKDRQHNIQKKRDKQRSTKHNTEN